VDARAADAVMSAAVTGRRTRLRRALVVACLLLLGALVGPADALATAPRLAPAGGGTSATPIVLARADPYEPTLDPTADRTSYDVRATYDVDAHLDWARGSLHVSSLMHLTNTSGGPLTRLELNTVAAKLGRLQLLSASVDGRSVSPQVTGQTLIVTLPARLPENASTSVRIVYRARFRHSFGGDDWLWSQTNGIVSAYRFIPWVSRRVTFIRPNSGDPFVTPVSPLVRVTLSSDRRLTWATSGVRAAGSGLSQTFEAHNVRDFNFTASPAYSVRSGLSADRQTAIRVYTRWGDAAAILRFAKRAFTDYEARVGSYPYPTFSVAEVPGGFGMESPALIWIPRSAPFLDYLVSHETAHQWFYATVGNDQSTNEFADEALADFLARTHIHLFRGSRCGRDRFDLPIYHYSRACYYEVIYIQGSTFLDRLRRDMGDANFWGAVRQYYAHERFRVSSNRELLDTLRSWAGDWVLPRYHARFPSLF
jgi:hypothetical protein